MKKTLLLMALSLYLISNAWTQPPDIMGQDYSAESDRTLNDDCIVIHLDLGKKLIVTDCPEYDYYSLDTDRSFSIKTSAICLTEGCYLDVTLSFDGQVLYEQRIHGEEDLHIPVDYSVLLQMLGKTFSDAEATLEIRYQKTCIQDPGIGKPQVVKYDPVTESIPIQVRSEFDTYWVDVVVDMGAFDLCPELYGQNQEAILKASSCCGTEKYFDVNIRNVEGKELSISGKISLGTKYPAGNSSLNLGIEYSEKQYQVSQLVQSMGISRTYHSDDGSCIYPGLKLYYKDHEIRQYQVICGEPDILLGVSDTYREIFRVEPTFCTFDFDCNGTRDPRPVLYFSPVNRLLASPCSADLGIVLQDPVPGMHYEYEWLGPDGQTYSTHDLTDVPYGKYELTIYDGCCNAYQYTYNVCDQIEYGSWYYENGMYCRTVLCACEDILSLRSAIPYTMCILPHRYGEWYLNENTKQCNRHAYWTDQDGVETDLTMAVGEADIDSGDERVAKDPIRIQEYYDQDQDRCIREYYCSEETTGYLQQADPEYGDWGYDAFWEECYREVLCFGEKAMDPDGGYAENEQGTLGFGPWEYDEFWDDCYRKIYCSGEPPFDAWGEEIVDEAEEISIEWTIENPGELECVGLVYCNGDVTSEEVTTTPEVSWDLDELGNCVTTTLECDGTEQDNLVEEPNDFEEWEYDEYYDLCFRQVYCETAGEWFDHYVVTHFWPDYTNGGDCDATIGEFSYQIICDGEESGQFVCRDQPFDAFYTQLAGSDFFQGPKKESTVEKGPQNQPVKSSRFYRIKIYAMDGRLQWAARVASEKEIPDVINQFRLSRPDSDQLYLYTVHGESEFLYAQKFTLFHTY
jgi:hypothetical protein